MTILNGMSEDYPLAHRWVVAPNIRVNGDELRYDPLARDSRKWRWVQRPNSRLLWEFVQLVDAPPERIKEYAEKWGCLGLCWHRWPAEHYRLHPDSKYEKPDFRSCEPCGYEPLDSWRAHARAFANCMQSMEQSRTEPAKGREIAAKVSALASNFGHLRPILVPTHSTTFGLRLAGPFAVGGLAAGLSYQLLSLMTEGGNLLICAECGKWFPSDKRRSPERDAFCPKCGRPASVRAARRRYYQSHKPEVLAQQKKSRKEHLRNESL
jgi:hypothetical protein